MTISGCGLRPRDRRLSRTDLSPRSFRQEFCLPTEQRDEELRLSPHSLGGAEPPPGERTEKSPENVGISARSPWTRLRNPGRY